MATFSETLSKLSLLDNHLQNELETVSEVKTYKKGETILAQGGQCRYLYHVKQGLVKLCFENSKSNFVMRFFAESAILTELESFTTQKPSRYAIVALEPLTLNCIDHQKLEALCKKHHQLETAYRKFLTLASRNMINRISEMLEEDATRRYHNFLEQNAGLIQRISLGELSSYLGITQVSLSRIRAQK